MGGGVAIIAALGLSSIIAEDLRCRRKLAKLDRLQRCVNHCDGSLITLERMLRDECNIVYNRTHTARKGIQTR